MAQDPARFPNIAVARAHVWKTSPELAVSYEKLPTEEAAFEPERFVAKGSAVVERATAKAQELMKAEPEKYRDIAQARAEVWRREPELSAEFDRKLLDKAAPVGGQEEAFQEVQRLIGERTKPGVSREQVLLQIQRENPDLVRRAYGI